MELITLAMPVYNVEPYVEKALLSALNQTYENILYIIVDDKGCDRSIDVVRKLISTHPRGKAVKIIEHPTNIGTGAARNSAMDAAQGNYLYFMDSDDAIAPDCIQKLYDEMKRSDVDFVVGSVESSLKDTIVERDKNRMINIFNNIYTWNKLYKLSFLRENHIQCIPYHTVEDPYFTFQVSVKAHSYAVIPDITYFHYQRNNSNSGSVWGEKLFKQFPEIFSSQLEFLKKAALAPSLRRKYKRKLFWFRVTISKFTLKSPASLHRYINLFLSSTYLKDNDTLHEKVLFLGYILSKMPLVVKIGFLKFHLYMTNKNKQHDAGTL